MEVSKMKRYTVGFMMSPSMTQVALITKGMGHIDEGRLNGVGGEVEDRESPDDCMYREGIEELGKGANHLAWTKYAVVRGAGYDLHFYWALGVPGAVEVVRNRAEEPVNWYSTSHVLSSSTGTGTPLETADDVPEMLSMAVRAARLGKDFRVVEVFRRLPKLQDVVVAMTTFDDEPWKRPESVVERPESVVERPAAGGVRPAYYGGDGDPYEVRKVIRAWGLGHNLGNVLKYIRRRGSKAQALDDLYKARTYLSFEISDLEAEARNSEAEK
jgi:8-oxo-dGTP pyrophosphatase MutT (NUDIX family)